jgi:hypothetical protein
METEKTARSANFSNAEKALLKELVEKYLMV